MNPYKVGEYILKRFEILEQIGWGAQGRVLRAIDHNDSNIEKVLKEYKDEEHGIKEKEILEKLKHPNIINYYESIIDNKFYILIENCQDSLRGLLSLQIKKNTTFDELTILEWTYELVSAVQYIHKRNIIHRDIKPENILINAGKIKLCDFGVAKELTKSCKAYTEIGTEKYQAPEFFKHPAHEIVYDSKCDICQ